MPPVKSVARASEKWERQSAAATPEYLTGVADPKTDWATATAAAEKNYVAGVQAAAARGAFGKGVKRAGTSKWQENAINKGGIRWAAGIAISKPAYEEGFAPYRAVIEATNLPPRGPVGDPANIARVAAMAKALHDKKLQLQKG